MSILVAVATYIELDAIVAGFNGRKRGSCVVQDCIKAGNRAVYCPVNEHDCYFLLTGVGPIGAALALQKAFGEFSAISAVLSLGIGGSFDLEKARVGSIVIANEEMYPEYGIYGQERLDRDDFPLPQYEGDFGEVWDSIVLQPENYSNFFLNIPQNTLQGRFVTVSSVSATPERALHLKKAYSPLVENMEGFGLAFCCHQSGIPFMELRAVSNPVGDRDKSTWDLSGAFKILGDSARFMFS